MIINFINTSTRSPNKASGFTLVELLVVVAIIAMIGALAIPNLSPANARLKQAARELYGNMQRARLEAIKTNRNVGIFFDTANSQYFLCQNFNNDQDCTDIDLDGDGLDIDTDGDGIVEDVDNDGDTEIILATVAFSNYVSNIQYGCGAATQDVNGGACPANGVTSTVVVFAPTGRPTITGYAYLQNDKNTTYAIGTKIAGVVVIRKWTNTSWQ